MITTLHEKIPQKCNDCDHSFKWKIQLLEHRREVHGKFLRNWSTSEGSQICPECGFLAKTRQKLKNHALSHTVIEIRKQPQSISSPSYDNKPVKRMPRPIIPYNQSLSELDTEMSKQNGLWSCHHCEKTNLNKSIMQKHIESKHRIVQVVKHQFPCELCEYKSNEKQCLKQHIDENHEGIYKYAVSVALKDRKKT